MEKARRLQSRNLLAEELLRRAREISRSEKLIGEIDVFLSVQP